MTDPRTIIYQAGGPDLQQQDLLNWADTFGLLTQWQSREWRTCKDLAWGVAQSVERRVVTSVVAGSSPASPAKEEG